MGFRPRPWWRGLGFASELVDSPDHAHLGRAHAAWKYLVTFVRSSEVPFSG